MFSGQGVIGISLLANAPNVETALLAEINPEQYRCICETLGLNGFSPDRVQAVCTDLFDGIQKDQRFDLIVGNPPHQDRSAGNLWDLQGADPGLNIHRRFLKQLGERLATGGRAYLIENRLLTSPEDIRNLMLAEAANIEMQDSLIIHGTVWRIDAYGLKE